MEYSPPPAFWIFLVGLWRQHLCSRNWYPLWSQQSWSFAGGARQSGDCVAWMQIPREAAGRCVLRERCRVFDNQRMTLSKKFGSSDKVIPATIIGTIQRKNCTKNGAKTMTKVEAFQILPSSPFQFWGGTLLGQHPRFPVSCLFHRATFQSQVTQGLEI